MRKSGMTRRIDTLGRLVIPKEMRNSLEIKEGDAVEFSLDGEKILITKYAPNCVFCGSRNDISVFKGKKICSACLKEIKENR